MARARLGWTAKCFCSDLTVPKEVAPQCNLALSSCAYLELDVMTRGIQKETLAGRKSYPGSKSGPAGVNIAASVARPYDCQFEENRLQCTIECDLVEKNIAVVRLRPAAHFLVEAGRPRRSKWSKMGCPRRLRIVVRGGCHGAQEWSVKSLPTSNW